MLDGGIARGANAGGTCRIEHARRKLPESERLRVCRQDSHRRSELGRHYIVDQNNMLVA